MEHENDKPDHEEWEYLDDPYALARKRGIVGGQRV